MDFTVHRRQRGILAALLLVLALTFGVGFVSPERPVVSSIERPAVSSIERSVLGLADTERLVVYIQAEGPLTPAMVSYVRRGLRAAQGRDAVTLIFRLDTPGGQIDLTQDIVKVLRESQTPVVVYVAPRGAAAWSAGTIIALAGHVIAMAPETSIGAASPVSGGEEGLGETEERKAKEAVRALVRDLAAPRGDEVVAWAEAAIEDAVAATSSEAHEMGLADLIVDDLDDLLAQLDGLEVQVQGEWVVLRTAGARVERVSMNFVERVLHIVVNPNVIVLLMAIGVQAILIEISNPGGWVAGFIGIVCIALGVYGLGVLPVNGLGLVLLALSVGLFALDIKAPTHGALTTAGVATMIAGALILFNSGDAPSYARISLPYVVVIALCFAATTTFIMTKALQAQRPQPETGAEGLMGAMAKVRSDLDPKGTVFVQGERWHAVAQDGPIAAGEQVEIVDVEGLLLHVRRKANDHQSL